ncbi:MAG: hypothetical protein ABJD13_06585 [Paracoccaceae bacterium]
MNNSPVAEIVTFRLANGADKAAFLKAAKGMEPFLASTGAMVKRNLSRDQDGVWTDHIEWTSMQAAKDAATAMMQRPEAGPFMSLIDEQSVTMRHAEILITQG